MSLRLVDQDDRVALPVYGLAATVQGAVEVNKTEGIASVEVQASRSCLESEPDLDDRAFRLRVSSSWKR